MLPPLAEKPSAERQAFIQGLREVGYDKGHNVVIEYRSAAWNRELLPDLAAELVERRVDVILAAGPQATLAAREATKTILNRDDRRGRPRRERARRQPRPARRERHGFSASLPELGGNSLDRGAGSVSQPEDAAGRHEDGPPGGCRRRSTGRRGGSAR